MKNTAPLAESSIGNWSLANVCSGGWVGCWGEGVGLWRPGEPFRSRLCPQGGPRRRCALGRSARLGSPAAPATPATVPGAASLQRGERGSMEGCEGRRALPGERGPV